jgi:hypothetical protein
MGERCVSLDGELWTREAGDLRDVLPRAADWDYDEDGAAEIVVGRDLVFVSAAEEDADLPLDLASIASGQRFRIDWRIEPISCAPETLAFAIEVVEAVARAWGGLGVHPRTGHTTVWES